MIGRVVVGILAFAVLGAAPAPGVRVSVSPTVVPQGGTVEVVVSGLSASRAWVRFAGRTWPLYESGGVWRTFLGTDPLTAPGPRGVTIETAGPSGTAVAGRAALTVRRIAFPVRRITLAPDRRTLLDPRLAQEEGRKVAAALRVLSAGRLWRGAFRVPVRGTVTSPYGVVSVYQGQIRGFHRGVDLAAAAGTPVSAANDGIVRLAATLPLSGKAVLLDHGMGIVTSYLHQSSVLVRPGQRVRRGEILGRVGSTGLSTGPHLHWGLRINGIHVDPMPWTR
jgi:murein DD-endopeptidase MepM/ murein hydrolase activator NlpD